MTRPIKYRAWNKKTKIMVMDVHDLYDHLGSYYDNRGNEIDSYQHLSGSSFGHLLEDKDLVVMQFTGLLDKNGKEIYEGDVVKGNPIGSAGIRLGKVEWMNDGWFVSDESDRDNEKRLHADFFSKVEIIGNIYENPELLK